MITKGKYGKIKFIQYAFRISLVQCLAWAANFLHDTDDMLLATVDPVSGSAGKAVAGEPPPFN